MTKEEVLKILDDIDRYCWIEEISLDIEKIRIFINKK